MKTSIKAFYTPAQVNSSSTMANSYSKSPLKPRLYMDKVLSSDIAVDVVDNFKPFTNKDFELAHTRNYVDAFMRGRGKLATSNSVPWSKELRDSVKFTNSSLYNAILHSVLHPQDLTISPTSGFHHAGPSSGSGFCTFSGQVIAAVKLFKQANLVGAFLDLDGHFGNSIEDSRRFIKQQHGFELSQAIRYNINPAGSGERYIADFTQHLQKVRKDLLDGTLHYVVWCHGADSHEWDQLGHQCSTAQWLQCSELFYTMIAEVEEIRQQPVPVTLSLFGGYRHDDYDSVINLHVGDLAIAQRILLGKQSNFQVIVKNPQTRTFAQMTQPQQPDPSEIDLTIDVAQYFSAYDVKITSQFSLSDLAEIVGLPMEDVAVLLCNLEDEDTMQEIADGDYYTSFDIYDNVIFNDSYFDVMEQLGLAENTY